MIHFSHMILFFHTTTFHMTRSFSTCFSWLLFHIWFSTIHKFSHLYSMFRICFSHENVSSSRMITYLHDAAWGEASRHFRTWRIEVHSHVYTSGMVHVTTGELPVSVVIIIRLGIKLWSFVSLCHVTSHCIIAAILRTKHWISVYQCY